MTRPQLGDGNVIDVGSFDIDERDVAIESLKNEVKQLRREVSDANLRADRAQEDANRALGGLRRQLSPLYRALQSVFGELEAAGVHDGPAEQIPTSGNGAAAAGTSPRLEAWKARLSPACGKIIDALVLHHEMNASQLKVACKLGTSTVSDALKKLVEVGVVDRSGGVNKIRPSAK